MTKTDVFYSSSQLKPMYIDSTDSLFGHNSIGILCLYQHQKEFIRATKPEISPASEPDTITKHGIQQSHADSHEAGVHPRLKFSDSMWAVFQLLRVSSPSLDPNYICCIAWKWSPWDKHQHLDSCILSTCLSKSKLMPSAPEVSQWSALPVLSYLIVA